MNPNHNKNKPAEKIEAIKDTKQIRTAIEEKKHTLIRSVEHCGMPIDVFKDATTGDVDSTVFCYGCHRWVQVSDCKSLEKKDAKKN